MKYLLNRRLFGKYPPIESHARPTDVPEVKAVETSKPPYLYQHPFHNSLVKIVSEDAIRQRLSEIRAREGSLINDAVSKWTASTESGTHYEISSETLQHLQDGLKGFATQSLLPAPMNLRGAHEMLASFLNNPLESEAAAHGRLREAFEDPRSASRGWFIKIVHDLDTVLFRCMLQGRLCISWEDDWISGMSDTDGARTIFMQSLTDFRSSWIQLSKDCYSRHTKLELFGIVTHEMLHAFLSVMTQGNDARHDEGDTYDSAHGRMYQESSKKIVRRLNFHNLKPRDVYNVHAYYTPEEVLDKNWYPMYR